MFIYLDLELEQRLPCWTAVGNSREVIVMRTRPSQLGLPPRYRQHALGKLEAVIAKAEKERSERLRAIEHLSAAKKSTAQAKARLRLVEYRLALLYGSRQWLASGTPPVA